jgi:hypothetical protein
MKSGIKVVLLGVIALLSITSKALTAADIPLPPGVMNIPPRKSNGKEQLLVVIRHF